MTLTALDSLREPMTGVTPGATVLYPAYQTQSDLLAPIRAAAGFAARISHGRFGFDEYIDHIVRFLDVMGPGAHVVAVCQPCVAALVATAVMAQGDCPARPRSLTLMAGPIDARVNPTKVNELATSKPIAWFERNLIASV